MCNIALAVCTSRIKRRLQGYSDLHIRYPHGSYTIGIDTLDQFIVILVSHPYITNIRNSARYSEKLLYVSSLEFHSPSYSIDISGQMYIYIYITVLHSGVLPSSPHCLLTMCTGSEIP